MFQAYNSIQSVQSLQCSDSIPLKYFVSTLWFHQHFVTFSLPYWWINVYSCISQARVPLCLTWILRISIVTLPFLTFWAQRVSVIGYHSLRTPSYLQVNKCYPFLEMSSFEMLSIPRGVHYLPIYILLATQTQGLLEWLPWDVPIQSHPFRCNLLAYLIHKGSNPWPVPIQMQFSGVRCH